MRQNNIDQRSDQTNFVLGGVLIVLGAVFLVSQLFGIRLGHYVWPFYIMVPGVLLFIFALSAEGEQGGAIAIFGSVVTMVGLLLFYQNMANHFQSWAYGWALVAPTSIGLGQMLYGTLKERAQMVRDGKRLATIGVTIFLIGAVFFELIIGISGLGIGRIGRFVWPLLLIGAGTFFLLRNLLPGAPGAPVRMPADPMDPMLDRGEPETKMEIDDITEEQVETEEMEDVPLV